MISINKTYIIDVLCSKDKKLEYIEDRIIDLSKQLEESKKREIGYKSSDILKGVSLKEVVPGKVSSKYYETGFPFVERQIDIELKHQHMLEEQINVLLDEKESIYRIWTIYNSLNDVTHQLFDLIYIKKYKWEAARNNLELSNNKFASIKKTGIDDILRLYNSSLTIDQIRKLRTSEPKQVKKKDDDNSLQISFELIPLSDEDL